MSDLERALEIAFQGHKGQRERNGRPYILHPLRVMLQQKTEKAMIVAILHDLVEDTQWTLEQLTAEKFSQEIIQAVDAMTHREDESYEDYLLRVKENPLAVQVKLADLKDNTDITRLKEITEKDFGRLKKYHNAWLSLTK